MKDDKPTLRRIEEEYIGGRIDAKEYLEKRKQYLFQDKKKKKWTED